MNWKFKGAASFVIAITVTFDQFAKHKYGDVKNKKQNPDFWMLLYISILFYFLLLYFTFIKLIFYSFYSYFYN